MTGILQTLGSVVTGVADMVSTWMGVIFAEGNELLLLFAIIPLVGIGIGLIKRLLRVD